MSYNCNYGFFNKLDLREFFHQEVRETTSFGDVIVYYALLCTEIAFLSSSHPHPLPGDFHLPPPCSWCIKQSIDHSK
jgi:hypothetical protein